MKIHFVLFQDGRDVNLKDKRSKRSGPLPVVNYTDLKRKIIDSIERLNSNVNYQIHSFDLNNLNQVNEYQKILETQKYRGYTHRYSQCFYQTWKPVICNHVIQQCNDGDIIYYIDCSRYHPNGFEYNVEKMIKYLQDNHQYQGIVAGAITKQSNNELIDHHILDVIRKTMEIDCKDKYHVMASWFIFTKNQTSVEFFKEWVKWTFTPAKDYIDIHGNKEPILGVISGLPEQSILSALVVKYKLYCFPGFKNYNDILEKIHKGEELNLQSIF